jgi:hypothetical protein
LAEVSKEVQGILVIGLVLIVVGAVGIVVLNDQSFDLSTGFGLLDPDPIQIFEVKFTDPGIFADAEEHTFYLINTPVVVSIVLLIVAIVLWWWKIKK